MDFRLPARAALDAQLSSAGSGGFVAQVTAMAADADDTQDIKGASERLRLPQLGSDVQPQLVIIAPSRGGTLILDALEIVPTFSLRRGGDLSAWAWSPKLWRSSPSRLVKTAQLKGVERLFVTLDIADGELRGEAELRNFVRLAGLAGIKVEAVEGDPRMVLDDGLKEALGRARAYAAYQRNSPAAARLAGIQYDIEPYSLPGWSGDANDHGSWKNAVLRVSEAAGEPVDLVLPFWINASDEGARFLDQVAGSIRGLTIMSYRTDAPGLTQIAEPLLAWGSRVGKPVRLALEAGPLDDETEATYRPAAAGTIALMEGPEPRILLLDSSGNVTGARMYRLSHQSVIRGARLSFLGQEDAMKGLAARASAAFSAWPAFSGFALHGLSWTITESQSAGAR